MYAGKEAYDTGIGFTSEQLGLGIRAGSLTYDAILCYSSPTTAPYTYDTLQAMMDATVEQALSQKGKSRLVTRFVRSPVGGFCASVGAASASMTFEQCPTGSYNPDTGASSSASCDA